MLTFPIKKQWFDMIKSGEKRQEYRDYTPYYLSRLGAKLQTECMIKFRNGYSKTSPYMICHCKIHYGIGRTEWGAVSGKKYFVLDVLEIVEAYP